MRALRLASAILPAALGLSAPSANAQTSAAQEFVVSCRLNGVDVTFYPADGRFFLKAPQSVFPARTGEAGDVDVACAAGLSAGDPRAFATSKCDPIRASIAFEPDFQSALERVDDDQTGPQAREVLRAAALSGSLFSATLTALDQSIPVPDDEATLSTDLVCRATEI